MRRTWEIIGESILDFNARGEYEDLTDEEYDAFAESVDENAKANGLDLWADYVCVNQSGCEFIANYNDVIDCVTRTDGCDLVKFTDGNLGFVGYPVSGRKPWIKFLRLATDADDNLDLVRC